MAPSEEKLLAILAAAEVLTETDLRMAKVYRDRWQVDIFETLHCTNLVSQAKLVSILSDSLGLPVFGPSDAGAADMSLLMTFDYNDARRIEAIPVARLESQAIKVVMANPADEANVAFIQQKLGSPLALFVAERHLVRKLIDELYPVQLQLANIISCF